MQTDLTFFTNEPGATLLDRFIATLNDVRFFDIIVGYFRSSGFFRLYPSFAPIEKIRILVGLSLDKKTFQIIETANNENYESHAKIKELFGRELVAEIDNSADTKEVEEGIIKFVEYLRAGKIEIKAHPSRDLHAKVYISRYHEDDRDFGNVITGSSNFSESGLVANREFNVQLKNSSDVKFALEQFEKLWQEAVDISDYYVDTITTQTFLDDTITPYELYLKFLYEYFKEDLSIDEELFFKNFPKDFMQLKYQEQAVINAKKILQEYGGVFLADVVGLGKTYISALLANQLLRKNKTALIDNLTDEELQQATVQRGRDNSLRILKILKSKEMKTFDGFTEIDEDYIKRTIKLLEDGAVPKSATKRIYEEIKELKQPARILTAVKRNLPEEFFRDNSISHDHLMESPGEVILSECFVK